MLISDLDPVLFHVYMPPWLMTVPSWVGAAFRLTSWAYISLIIITLLNGRDVIYKQVPLWVETLLTFVIILYFFSKYSLLILNLRLGDDWKGLLSMTFSIIRSLIVWEVSMKVATRNICLLLFLHLSVSSKELLIINNVLKIYQKIK